VRGTLDKIAVGRNRVRQITGRDLVSLFMIERIGAPDFNRISVPINRDPL
jgi:hypothetical protein